MLMLKALLLRHAQRRDDSAHLARTHQAFCATDATSTPSRR